ncbi:hypothetical protein [Ideonella sp. YS5]|uniref:hypothetical protein n=1 Tax=Ideonella sp. YS5 TaxID=3453714 RepID=UPI003EEFF1B6
MGFPPITGLVHVVHPENVPSQPSSPVSLTGTASGDAESMDMWQYFVEHIEEFEVAKAIVDHFDTNPTDLHRAEVGVDAFALFLRAKITLKRQAVAYATAQAALTKAREQSRGLKSVARAICKSASDVRHAVEAQPQALALMLIGIGLVMLR